MLVSESVASPPKDEIDPSNLGYVVLEEVNTGSALPLCLYQEACPLAIAVNCHTPDDLSIALFEAEPKLRPFVGVPGVKAAPFNEIVPSSVPVAGESAVGGLVPEYISITPLAKAVPRAFSCACTKPVEKETAIFSPYRDRGRSRVLFLRREYSRTPNYTICSINVLILMRYTPHQRHQCSTECT